MLFPYRLELKKHQNFSPAQTTSTLSTPSWSLAHSWPRLALCIFLIEAMGGVWVVEQPSLSMLRFHPRVMDIFERCKETWFHFKIKMVMQQVFCKICLGMTSFDILLKFVLM